MILQHVYINICYDLTLKHVRTKTKRKELKSTIYIKSHIAVVSNTLIEHTDNHCTQTKTKKCLTLILPIRPVRIQTIAKLLCYFKA